MSVALPDRLRDDPERARLYLQEKLILEVTEEIARLMVTQGVRRSELAKKLGKTKSSITQLLDGTSNLQIRTISDVLWALGAKLHVRAEPLATSAPHESAGFELPEGIESLMLEDNEYVQSYCDSHSAQPEGKKRKMSHMDESQLRMVA